MCAIRAEDVGAGTLAGDSDVSISSPTNGQVLTYSTSAGKWENANASGGGAGGTPPTVVQFDSASVNSTAPSVTMGTAPVNGNLLVAFVFGSSSTPTANTGWTLQTAFSQGSGFWYFYMFTKVAGAGESTTQSPVTAGSSGYWTVGIYEIDGQNATTPVLLTASQYAANNVYATTPVFPGFENTLALFAGVPSTGQTYTVTNVLGCAVVDANLTTAAGAHAAFGHTDSNSPLYNMTLTYSASVPSDIGMIVITH
jgi:hypothetical protein